MKAKVKVSNNIIVESFHEKSGSSGGEMEGDLLSLITLAAEILKICKNTITDEPNREKQDNYISVNKKELLVLMEKVRIPMDIIKIICGHGIENHTNLGLPRERLETAHEILKQFNEVIQNNNEMFQEVRKIDEKLGIVGKIKDEAVKFEESFLLEFTKN